MSKKILDFYKKIGGMDTKESLEKYLLFTLSPVIGGLKPSSTITLSYDKKEYSIWSNYKKEFLEILKLKEIVLRKGTKAEIILIYNEENLLNCINKKDNREFLNKLGYDLTLTLEENLDILVYRYEKYHCPHELGVFLGIPIEDVIDFMGCSDKKCLMCGYWKVFNNYNNAKDIFNKYDISKNIMIKSIEENKALLNIVDMFNKNIKFSIKL
ncbi:hypothetical protein HMPREF1092_01655 [Clostridium thermobutyricum]|uniref:DUF3793 domain-containing protein n=1 Tax=Clostridium thermobutyricum TaxID=29372 RepID=N9WHQ0_9CLOT|nr:DUF3793 family protein [Clostridium thermobutyricum]ENZ02420.1 hypothetical protein HMPREF1092_01655 [Clostridium thermobutyricum]